MHNALRTVDRLSVTLSTSTRTLRPSTGRRALAIVAVISCSSLPGPARLGAGQPPPPGDVTTWRRRNRTRARGRPPRACRATRSRPTCSTRPVLAVVGDRLRQLLRLHLSRRMRTRSVRSISKTRSGRESGYGAVDQLDASPRVVVGLAQRDQEVIRSKHADRVVEGGERLSSPVRVHAFASGASVSICPADHGEPPVRPSSGRGQCRT